MTEVGTLRLLFMSLLITTTVWILYKTLTHSELDWKWAAKNSYESDHFRRAWKVEFVNESGNFSRAWKAKNVYESDYFSRAREWTKLLESNTQCQIPDPNPFEDEIMKIVPLESSYPNCSDFLSYFIPGVGVDGKPVLVRKPSFPHDKLVCCWSIMEFMKEAPFSLTNRSQVCRPILQNETEIPVPADTQFVEIKCIENNASFFNEVDNINQSTIEILESKKIKLAHQEPIFFVPEPKPSKDVSENRLNVILFGLDAVSRPNFIRLMRNSYRFLSKELNAIELHGYNSLASGTLPNYLGFLTGLNFSAVRSSCWKTDETPFDDCPWIWKSYGEKGFTTLFAEDYESFFFEYLGGFRKQPTDYYLHPFHKWLSSYINCFGDTPMLHFIERYAKEASWKLRNVTSFQMYWCGRTYKSPSDPFFIDDALTQLLQSWKGEGILNRSAVVILSDHGYRIGKLLETKQGRLENRMPFAFLLLPKWFQEKYKEAYGNLVENQWRLTTPFDIHATLVDLIDIDKSLSSTNIERRVEVSEGRKEARAISLFLPIPKDRDCEMAGVDQIWCVCGNYQLLDFNGQLNVASKEKQLINRLGSEAVERINERLSPHRHQCMEYSLWKVLEAEKLVRLRNSDTDHRITYRLSIQVRPQGAIFQVVMFYDESDDKIFMSSEVFRTNSFLFVCLNHYEFWQVCTCNDSAENALKS